MKFESELPEKIDYGTGHVLNVSSLDEEELEGLVVSADFENSIGVIEEVEPLEDGGFKVTANIRDEFKEEVEKLRQGTHKLSADSVFEDGDVTQVTQTRIVPDIEEDSLDKIDIETTDGEELKLKLPSEREIENKLKMAIAELVFGDSLSLSMEDVRMEDAQRIYEKCMKKVNRCED